MSRGWAVCSRRRAPRFTSRRPAGSLFLAVKVPVLTSEPVAFGTEQRFSGTDEHVATGAECVAETLGQRGLHRRVEIDGDVPAEEEVVVAAERVLQQVGRPKVDPAAQLVDDVERAVLFAKILSPSGVGDVLDRVRSVRATGPGLEERFGIKVRGKQRRSCASTQAVEDHRNRVRLVAGRAACAPDLELRGAGQQLGEDGLFELVPLRSVAYEFGDVDGEGVVQILEQR